MLKPNVQVILWVHIVIFIELLIKFSMIKSRLIYLLNKVYYFTKYFATVVLENIITQLGKISNKLSVIL